MLQSCCEHKETAQDNEHWRHGNDAIMAINTRLHKLLQRLMLLYL